MTHEASLHDENSFITLTYRTECLPSDGSLSKRALQLFFKRLRFEILPQTVRYYACGEYGDTNGRPHYHSILFGFQFQDLKPWRKTPNGDVLYRSATLEKLWPWGQCEVGHVTHQSCGYVARYALKKVTGVSAVAHYTRPHPATGELFEVLPEFALMSRRPGIGGEWFAKFASDCFPRDFVTVNGSKLPVPRYYTLKLDEELDKLRLTTKRKAKAREPDRVANATASRLLTRDELQRLKQAKLKRDVGINDDDI